MTPTRFVIIACGRLSERFCYLTQIEYKNGNHVDYVGIYACGADRKENVAPFITDLMKDEYDEEIHEQIQEFLNTFHDYCIENIEEDFKTEITRQIAKIKEDSQNYPVELMDDLIDTSRYLLLPTGDKIDLDIMNAHLTLIDAHLFALHALQTMN